MEKVLLVGNPNSGKTTLFNSLAKANEHVGNWHGVTVENKSKVFDCDGQEFVLVDTPGLYSLEPLSFEEKVAAETILSVEEKKIINLCDQNNLQRNLYLTLCLIEKGCDVVVTINEIDKRPIFKVDFEKLSKTLGVPVVGINAEKKVGIDKLKKTLRLSSKKTKLPYLDKLGKGMKEDASLRYEFIDQILKECVVRSKAVYGKSKADNILLNKWLAFPVFLIILSAIFYLTFFSLGAFLSDILSGFFKSCYKRLC